ncbi:MAG: PTS transporter subunit EIIC [Klebsiella pneumoniae]|nr:PTS transporter subunit EIIC [Klebsiella pneumoniae]
MPISPQEIREVYEARLLVDRHCAEKICAMPDAERADIADQLDATIAEQDTALDGADLHAYTHLDARFHQIIMDSISTPLAAMGSVVGWAYVIFNSLLWFFGVHGSLALTALDNGIMTPWALENIALYNQYGSVDAAIEAGKQFHFWAKPMLDSYILLGGSGATLGLIIAIFIASRRADHRQVAKLALPSGIFQINEPILFGLPIIMNPVMFIPFVLVQPILAAITLAAYSLGIIPPVTNLAPWTMPTGLGAFFNSNGSVAALLVALFNLGVATLVYLPFVVLSNKAQTVIEQEESEEDIANALKF